MAPKIPGPKPGGDINLLDIFGDHFFGLFFKVVTGAVSGLFGVLADAAALVGMRWDQVDDHESNIADLETRAQKLEGVIGYGSAYMPQSSDWTFGEYTRLPFTARKGPIVGCTHNASTGTFTLGSKGLWEVNYKVFFDYLAGPVNKEVYCRAAVYAPNGTLFDESRIKGSSGDDITMQDSPRFVVPSSGYRLQIEAYSGTAYRGILTSRTRTAFNILKISDETD